QPIWNGLVSLKKKGIKIRAITEVTLDNIYYCKKLMEVGELRHLDGVRTNFGIADQKQVLLHGVSRESDPISQAILTSVNGFVVAQQYMFENLWNKAIPAMDKIKEIEEGIEPIQTKVLEDQDEIYNSFLNTIKKSKERYVCSSIGGMQIIYNNFFNLYKEIIEKQKRGEGNGIKWLTFIENNKKSIDIVKEFLDAGIQVRHIKNLPSMNFSFNSNSIQTTLGSMEEGKFMSRLLVSNEPAYVTQFTLFFKDLWDKYGIDAKERIKDIEEGMDYDIEVIRHSNRVWELYLDLIKSAQSEIFFIFPTPKAFIRQLKPLYLAKLVSRDRKAKIRILTPSNDLVEESINRLVEDGDDTDEGERANKIEQRNLRQNIDYFLNYDIKIRFIEKMSNTKATIVVIDRKHFLVMELKDDTKDTFIEAIGQSIHSTSKAGVLSYVAIFENLWKQSELYQEIKESNEKLKNNDKMQKEFINTAAHELRTPLQPIISLSQLLKNKTKDKEQKELLEIVIKNAKRLKELTEDILDVTKIEGGRLNLNQNALNIVDLLQSLIKEFERSVEDNKEIEFKLHFKNVDSNTIVFADRNRIVQVISNLVENSIKFISTENEKEDGIGLISINVEKTKINRKENESSNSFINGVTISIKDNGKGIDSEFFPRLFKKFASNSFQGTGLGLFIAKNIVEAHGGKIWASNNKDGEKGATFSFSLPLALQ
ncbi:MAG TPA: HAMP domain-containing sensor histidine kinase, partial [Candidatus Nitrosocosmicus sp.]|nr:HAMP domain-containing sensor histidine kinase [Candidatus Nitrosocosmicus sp.]